MDTGIAFILYFGWCLVVAKQGQYRNVGTMGPFFISLFLTPLAGAFVVATSKRRD